MNPEHLAAVHRRYQQVPSYQYYGITVLELTEGSAQVTMAWQSWFANSNGFMHGGVLATLIDSVIGIAARTVTSRITTTVECKVNFIRPVREQDLRANAEIMHKGNSLLVGRGDVFDSQGRLIATGTATYAMLQEDDWEKYQMPAQEKD
ncbi:MAG TPA: PaaI family thioesterase [Firmicutes bacterium]|nr:PaaI family thioesterase [Bacillota bacterium]